MANAHPPSPSPEHSYVDYAYDQPGSPPGTLQIRADAPPPQIVLIDYNAKTAVRQVIEAPEDCSPYLDTRSVSWIDIQGLGDESIWRRIAQVFELHPMILEDVVNVPQRPKVEDHEDQLVVVTHMVMVVPDQERFLQEQVSFVLGPNYLLTVQEEPRYDCFDPIRARIRYRKGSLRQRQADYLFYALLDAIIDGYFPVLELYGERLEALETKVTDAPHTKTLAEIHQIKRELLSLRRSVWPHRDAIAALLHKDNPLISTDVKIYLRDCYEHVVQVLDMLETYRELASSLMDVYLSAVSNRMNEVMKTLTVISTIFIPLTFIAGIYGMNFNPTVSPLNMPELNWYWGYPAVWLLMLAVASGLVAFFWRRGWFENFSPADSSAKPSG
ncbi:Cobalt/magnesium transport protein CorA [Halomicronema hongdechloris C2206]|uniref:Magnesium transport protein CorA n=1 Tax=Halomicronema hongdechloris C2206 TaxID=1641165 RepID=A0A1Z3HP04_9CYAN|nr:magnesium/cobalt transporter CorA [Halomicronema hongdechloris]ASC72028.1 Cobalt/magnesium transport protein CorA [Halomicronema hongdechloris C2206]